MTPVKGCGMGWLEPRCGTEQRIPGSWCRPRTAVALVKGPEYTRASGSDTGSFALGRPEFRTVSATR